MANNIVNVIVKQSITYKGKVFVVNDELAMDAEIATNLSHRNLVTIQASEDLNTDELDGMTVDELREYAEEAGICLIGIHKKADIISAIREAV